MKKLFLMLLIIGLFACQSDDDQPSTPNKPVKVYIGYDDEYFNQGRNDCKEHKKTYERGALEGYDFDSYVTGWKDAGCDPKDVKQKFIDPRYQLPHAFRSNVYNLLPIGYAEMSLDDQAKNIFCFFKKNMLEDEEDITIKKYQYHFYNCDSSEPDDCFRYSSFIKKQDRENIPVKGIRFNCDAQIIPRIDFKYTKIRDTIDSRGPTWGFNIIFSLFSNPSDVLYGKPAHSFSLRIFSPPEELVKYSACPSRYAFVPSEKGLKFPLKVLSVHKNDVLIIEQEIFKLKRVKTSERDEVEKMMKFNVCYDPYHWHRYGKGPFYFCAEKTDIKLVYHRGYIGVLPITSFEGEISILKVVDNRYM